MSFQESFICWQLYDLSRILVFWMLIHIYQYLYRNVVDCPTGNMLLLYLRSYEIAKEGYRNCKKTLEEHLESLDKNRFPKYDMTIS